MAPKLIDKKTDDEEEDPLHEVTAADVERMDGVLGAASGHKFLLMRSEEGEGQTKRTVQKFSKEPEAKELLEEADAEIKLKRVGKTISAATEARIRATMDGLAGLLADSNAPAILPEGVSADMATQDKAGDKKVAHDVGAAAEDEPETETEDVQRAKKLGFESVKDLISAVERAQAPRIGTMNAPGYGGDPSDVNSQNNLPSSQPQTGVGGSAAGVVKPQADVKDATAAMAKAVGQTATNVEVATSEEELPDQAERIARSIGAQIKTAFEEGFKPLKETLEKIAAEDSRGQQKPFIRGAGPSGDYHLVSRDGSPAYSTDSAELSRALEGLDPTSRDVVTRELAKNSHPLLRGQQ